MKKEFETKLSEAGYKESESKPYGFSAELSTPSLECNFTFKTKDETIWLRTKSNDFDLGTKYKITIEELT